MTSGRSVDYDEIAEVYDRRYEGRAYAGIDGRIRALARASERVLEVGCGTGHWLGRLAEACAAVGLDPSREMLGQARARTPDAALVAGRAEALPFAGGVFDAVVAVNALHHFTDPARFAREAARTLRPTGRVVVIGLDPGRDEDDWYLYDYFEPTRARDRARYPGTGAIAGWLSGAGFVDLAVEVADRLIEEEPARPFLERGGAAKHATSQLLMLTDEEYRVGLDRIWADVRRAEREGRTHTLRCDLRLYATVGRLP